MTGSRKYARIAAASCGLFLTYEKKKWASDIQEIYTQSHM
jgi:hypothetical protein